MAPTKMTHIGMLNSCVIPLNDIAKEIGDRYYILGQNVTEAYTCICFRMIGFFIQKNLNSLSLAKVQENMNVFRYFQCYFQLFWIFGVNAQYLAESNKVFRLKKTCPDKLTKAKLI